MDNLIIYVISDSVGETAQQVTKAALSQFNAENDCEIRRFPYVADEKFLMEVLESLVLEYGVDEVLSALEVAKEKGTANVKYIEGVLKNRKIQSYADDRKSAKKDEQVDWDKESERVHGAT